MYIGIYDQDLMERKSFRPNLETMQISTYHKQKKDVVELILNCYDISRFDIVYLIKNQNDRNFNSTLLANKKVVPIGMGFTNKYKNYDWFCNLPADRTIYNKYIKIYYNKLTKKDQRRIDVFQNAGHCRLSFGDNKLNTIMQPQEKIIYVYDTNILEIEGAFEFLSQYKTVHIVYPIKTDNIELAVKWTNQKWYYANNKLIYVNTIKDADFKKAINDKINSKSITFLINIDLPGRDTKELFKLWLNRVLYVATRKKRITLEIGEKNDIQYYNSLFHDFAGWNNCQVFGSSIKDFLHFKKYSKIFDIMCEKDYNINRMVNIIPKEYKKNGGIWQYVN
jgi:Tfp pilus assembly major pilin PilA